MVEKDEHHGSVHDDQVNILKDDGFEINLAAVYPFKVFIKGYQTQENDEYKELVFKYAKGIDPSITDDVLEDYWSQTMDDLTNTVDFDEFELMLYMRDGQIEYLTICGDVQEK